MAKAGGAGGVRRNTAGRSAFQQKAYNAAKRSGSVKKNGEPTKKAYEAAYKALMTKAKATGRRKKKAAQKKATTKRR